jgi:hypothetical protein
MQYRRRVCINLLGNFVLRLDDGIPESPNSFAVTRSSPPAAVSHQRRSKVDPILKGVAIDRGLVTIYQENPIGAIVHVIQIYNHSLSLSAKHRQYL